MARNTDICKSILRQFQQLKSFKSILEDHVYKQPGKNNAQ